MTLPPGEVTIAILNAPLRPEPRGGNLRRAWEEASRTTLAGCWLQPIPGEEAIQDREFSRSNLRLFAPWTDDLKVTSRVEVDAVQYEVNGEPQRWPGPTAAPHHIEADLKRLTG